MIKKLKNKILLIILFAITIPLLLIVISYDISFYKNIVNINTKFIERFFNDPKANNKIREENKLDISDVDGIYSVIMRNDEILKISDNANDDIESYALNVANKHSDSGIIENYIYKKRIHNLRTNEQQIVLIENSQEINKIKIVFLSSLVATIIGIVIIYIIAKKIANIIVRPVEDTFSKQIDFISDASHELKTPLAVIRANADVLGDDIGKNKWLSYIQNEIDSMEKLINELILLTKIENVDKLRNPEKFNISEYIEMIVSTFESMAYEKNVRLETTIQKDVITQNFNKEDITHILSTLIDNAIKHTNENKKVIVEFKKNKDNIEINVKNKGTEIPLEERKKIFERFYRIDKSRNRNEKRYGLGLAIAKSTVLKNNGIIIVDYKNGYTIFNVRLPL